MGSRRSPGGARSQAALTEQSPQAANPANDLDSASECPARTLLPRCLARLAEHFFEAGTDVRIARDIVDARRLEIK